MIFAVGSPLGLAIFFYSNYLERPALFRGLAQLMEERKLIFKDILICSWSFSLALALTMRAITLARSIHCHCASATPSHLTMRFLLIANGKLHRSTSLNRGYWCVQSVFLSCMYKDVDTDTISPAVLHIATNRFRSSRLTTQSSRSSKRSSQSLIPLLIKVVDLIRSSLLLLIDITDTIRHSSDTSKC